MNLSAKVCIPLRTEGKLSWRSYCVWITGRGYFCRLFSQFLIWNIFIYWWKSIAKSVAVNQMCSVTKRARRFCTVQIFTHGTSSFRFCCGFKVHLDTDVWRYVMSKTNPAHAIVLWQIRTFIQVLLTSGLPLLHPPTIFMCSEGSSDPAHSSHASRIFLTYLF